MGKYIILIVLLLFAVQNESYGQKKKYCVVYYDQAKNKSDSSYSNSVISNVIKVREGDYINVKQEFNKAWNLKYNNSPVDTALLEITWLDSKPKAKRKQRELIDRVNNNPDAKLLLFTFEFEYKFELVFGK